METVVTIIMLLVVLGVLRKLSYHGIAGMIAVCVVAGAFVFGTTDLATSQSKTQIADWLSQPNLMLDTLVWLTIDVAFQICFCALAAAMLTGGGEKARSGKIRILYQICLWIPGLLIFPVLFALLTALIFALPGTDFALTGTLLALAVPVAGPLLALGIRAILPEKDLRLELMFMINLIIACLGIVATVNGRTAAVGTNSVEWGALAATLALLAGGTSAGYFLRKYRLSKQISKLK